MPAMPKLSETDDGEYDHDFRADPEKRKAALLFDHVRDRLRNDNRYQQRKRDWRGQRG